ncbi:MAG: polysaccharide biosynthesis/export family protein [Hyphomicrobiaceae bacterium]
MPMRLFSLLVLLSIALSACAHRARHDTMTAREEVAPASSWHVETRHDPAPAGGDWGSPNVTRVTVTDADPVDAYRLDTGDRLRVFVYGQPNLSRLYTVDHDGKIVVPLIGAVRARGLTVYGVAAVIRSRLGAQYVRDPQVAVDVHQNRPFFILGEVRNAGQYPYVTGMTVMTAAAIAGGYSERASERRARITRRKGEQQEILEVTADAIVEPGDTVYIYERFF